MMISERRASRFAPGSGWGIIAITALVLLAAYIGLNGSGMAVLALGGALALAFIVWPFFGLLLITATIPWESAIMGFGGSVTITRFLGILLAFCWLAAKLLKRESFARVVTSPYLGASLAFIALAALSSMWAEWPDVAVSGSFQLVQLFTLGIIAIDLLNSWDRFRWLVIVLLAFAGLAALTMIIEYLGGGVRRAGASLRGANGTPAMLITLLPFAYYLIRGERGLLKAFGALYFILVVLTVPITYSRMNMLVLPIIGGFLGLKLLADRRARPFVLATITAGVVLAPVVVPFDQLTKRAETIAPYLQASVGGSGRAEAPISSGRGYHLRVAFEQFQDHPLLGVGYSNYGYQFRDVYQFVVPGTQNVYSSARSPHSSHAGILADLGVVGFALWIALLVTCAAVGLRAYGRTKAQSMPDPFKQRILVNSALLSFGLQISVYALYMPNHREKLFWLVAALLFALGHLTRDAQAADPHPQSGPERQTAWSRLPV
jgi:O-antigen ligase